MKKAKLLVAIALVSGSMAWAGEKLEIIKAEYGAKDKWTDVTAVVKSKIADGVLKVDASNDLCEDPAPGLGKILKITVKAGDKQAVFKCEERKSIEIKPEMVAPAAKAQAEVRLVIVSAEYGAGTKKADVTGKVKEMLEEGTKKIAASNDLFGDPAEGEGKVLTVKYKFDGKEATVTANENESLELP
ncbi:MAG: DUF3395 domain-containing protein [Victivallales bacterium]|jgi:hypothetical protein